MKRRTPLSAGKRFALFFLLLLSGMIQPEKAQAQCTDWSVSAHLIASSTCAGNGSFSVTISGPDASNLTNIQYAMPIAGNGFSVPLNNSPVFNNIPSGTYQVSVVATCNGTYVGKNTTITVPGSYIPPGMNASLVRPSISCGATGQIALSMQNGASPYTIQMTGAPSNYTGPTVFTTTYGGYTVTGLPVGNYTFQAVDVCGSGTVPASVSVTSLPSTVSLEYNYPLQNAACDTLIVPLPEITENTAWQGYEYDTLIKVSMHVGNLIPPTPFQNINTPSFTVKLPAGKSLKDLYGQFLTYDVKVPCAPDIILTRIIPFPTVAVATDQNCNIDFKSTLSLTSMVCYPVTYSVVNTATGVSYGPYIAATPSYIIPSLPIGSYSLSYTTGDGYTGTGGFGTSLIVGNPYSVTVIDGDNGLNNYIQGFSFYTGVSSSSTKTVELFSGPAGYSFVASDWNYDNTYTVTGNQTPAMAGTVEFPAGNYVWKITDNCGTYFVPVTVPPSDLMHYTLHIDHTRQTCQGLWVTVKGTAVRNGQNSQFQYATVYNDVEWLNGSPVFINGGDSVLLTYPGVYTFVATSGGAVVGIDSSSYVLVYPNLYTVTDTLHYNMAPAAVDIDSSQGFICQGAGPGHGVIYVKGQGGIPFKNPAHYNYYLALQYNGPYGPFIANNTTGIFTNFGGNANDMYDVRVQDSCGAFGVQTLKILDLQQARVISNSTYTPCYGSSLQLTTIYLPGATYSWTGPNGFTSTAQSPVINNIGPQSTGVYHVTIITPQCMQPVKDSTILAVSANPPKPLASLNCNPLPPSLTITNPSPGYSYSWDISRPLSSPQGNFYLNYTRPSDTNYTKYITIIGAYTPIATDTTTGCFTYGDSVNFNSDPNVPLQVTIYSPHLQLCPGDTTILVAQSVNEIFAAQYQWFKNDVAIAGATNSSYVTWQPGNYKVAMSAGACKVDTSANVTISTVPLPSAAINAPVQEICMGDTAFIYANTGTGYSYTWYFNDSTISASDTATIGTTRQGAYKVVVSNGGCIAESSPIAITVDPAVIVNLVPATSQLLCIGDTVYFSTPANAAYTYTWRENGAIIPGAITNNYKAASSGTYMVTAKNAVCPAVSSQSVTVTISPAVIAGISAPIQEICTGDTAFIHADTGLNYMYTWFRNGSILNGSTAAMLGVTQSGDYKVSITNGGCTAVSATIHIVVDPAPIVNLIPGTDQSLCTGDTVHFSTPANASYTYTWQQNGTIIPGADTNTYQTASAGSYVVSVISGVCPVVSSQPVAVSILPTGVRLPGDTTICNDGPIAVPLSVSNGFSQVLWSTGETTDNITATTHGTYWVQAINKCGTFSDTIHIYTPADYAINFPADTLICNRANSAVFSVPGVLYNILWSNGSDEPSTTIDKPGTYWVQGTSPCGMITDTIHVSFCAPAIHSIQLSKDTICAGDCIDISAETINYPLQYQWSFVGGFPDSSGAQDPGTVCYSKEGIYNVGLRVVNAGGADALTTQVVVLSKPVPRFADTTVTVPYESEVMLPSCADAQFISWYKDDSLICTNCQSINIDARYYYSVYHCVVSNGGCKDSCSYKLQVVDIPHDLWLPDAFTPNGDGRNDMFHIITDNPNIQVTGLEVYNRWGQLVFVSHLNNEGWNGTIHGVPADMDTYYWMLKYKIFGQPEVYFKKGTVVLVR